MLIHLVKFEHDWRKGKSMVGLYKLLKQGSLVWIGGTAIPRTVQSSQIISDFQKCTTGVYVFVFSPTTL